MSLVVDASVAIKWITSEDDSDLAQQLLSHPLSAPAFLLLELSNALWKKVRQGQLVPLQAAAGLAEISSIVELTSTLGLEARALEIGLEIAHPIYDCLYLALAEAIDQPVVTADKRFIQSCERSRFGALLRPLV